MNFADPGLWVWQVANFNYDMLKRAADSGFRWIAIQIHSGEEAVVTGDYKALIQNAGMHGVEMAGFGWLVDDPVAEAETADRLLTSWGLAGYIANGEKSLGYTQDAGACPNCFNYSSAFCSRWKELRGSYPSFPFAFSSYAIFSTHDIHYAPWIEAGAVAMPQAYWNEFDFATPQASVDGALDVKQPWNGPPFGWPTEKIHVTFANYQSGARPIPSPEQYAASLLATSARGFNVYLGELMDNEQFDSYKALIPTLCATQRPPLSTEQLPYTGPYYGPSDTRGPDKGPTAKALKRALWRLGVEPSFGNPDEHYSVKLEQAMARWQKTVSISPTGQYGKGSYDGMRAAVAPDGSYAMDETCCGWIQGEAH